MTLPTCESCEAPIRWLLMRDRRRIPIDPTPNSNGSVWIHPDTGLGWFLDREDAQRARAMQETLYIVHHATCPNVERHRVPRAQLSLDI